MTMAVPWPSCRISGLFSCWLGVAGCWAGCWGLSPSGAALDRRGGGILAARASRGGLCACVCVGVWWSGALPALRYGFGSYCKTIPSCHSMQAAQRETMQTPRGWEVWATTTHTPGPIHTCKQCWGHEPSRLGGRVPRWSPAGSAGPGGQRRNHCAGGWPFLQASWEVAVVSRGALVSKAKI